MSEDAAFFLRLIVIGISAAFLIYQIQLRLMLYSGFRRRDRNRLDDLLDEYRKHKSVEMNDRPELTPVPSPDFHKLKVIRKRKEITYYFVNRGGDIFNMIITPLGNFKVIICPGDKIKHEESGCFIIRLAERNPSEALSMNIRYSNKNAEQKKETYVFILNEEIIKKLD
jgi:hypothetical protein